MTHHVRFSSDLPRGNGRRVTSANAADREMLEQIALQIEYHVLAVVQRILRQSDLSRQCSCHAIRTRQGEAFSMSSDVAAYHFGKSEILRHRCNAIEGENHSAAVANTSPHARLVPAFPMYRNDRMR